MKISLVSTPNGIDTLRGAKKYCQDFARLCYSEKNMEGVHAEAYSFKLVDRLIHSGHHSVFDHFNMSLYLEDVPKAMAMVLNNEPPYATSEKSARYTEMDDVPDAQKILYDKWKGIFVGEIGKIYPKSVPGREEKISKLAQENARYVTSVFTPTKMGYTISIRQMNILADNFEWLGGCNPFTDVFKNRLFQEGVAPFLESEVVERFRISGLRDKSDRGVKLFAGEVEEHFGEDAYSTNLQMSLACLAQNQRHRVTHNHISSGPELGAPMGYFVPPIIGGNSDLESEWISDLNSISDQDFPQAQIIGVAERGNREDLEMKLRERNCGLAQLEIAKVMDGLVQKYSSHIEDMGRLRGATCLSSGSRCEKGGCVFGPQQAISRVV
ncbi:MAG: FAD-dependent thymidylate synthase [Nitrososphaerales archaeon]|jgi:hypothetical protein|nr:FAD-dependent thymidylate synthase [Nitrososphaerales archaeon]